MIGALHRRSLPRLAILNLFSLGALLLLVSAVQADQPPLHERVDALVERAAVGPLAPQASDADFLRRVYLDFTGVIPTADQARAFFADQAPDKRVKLIDQLLASPQFARHMAITFDVMLMERRPDKVVKTDEWQDYLKESFAQDKPLDQLCRELIVADGSPGPLHPASRFLLDRDCEPNVVTRDIGRMMFGMDLQCAQCHDHPLIDDYYQADYYGLFAFLQRSSLFADKKKKISLVAEKAEGEASFKSVFTSEGADRVTPRLPKGAALYGEPVFAKGKEYEVAPAKDVRPVPKFSRREQLAEMLAESPEFRRNWANRLWAHLFGRGIVHPVDFHHAGNPPSNPELLTLLAEELAKAKFSTKAMLRELALTRAYQRTCEAPQAESVTMPPMSDEVARLEGQRTSLTANIGLLKEKHEKAVAAQEEARKKIDGLKSENAKLEKELAARKAEVDKLTAEQKKAAEALAKKKEQSAAVANASSAASAAVAKIPDDKSLIRAAAQIAERAKALATEVEAATKSSADLAAKITTVNQQLAAAQQAFDKATAGAPTPEKLAELEQAALAAEDEVADARYAIAALDAQIASAQAIGDYQEKAKSDAVAAEPAWNTIVDTWAAHGQLANLKSLTAEQFALSLMQATSALERQYDASRAALEKKPPEELKKAAEADKPTLLARLVEDKTYDQVRKSLPTFVTLYGTLAGADFQATVNQSLFFENGSTVQGWINTAAAELAKQQDAAALAEELYLSVFTRLPSDQEKQDVAAYLKDRADRPAAVGEMLWALLASNEFRFNH